jgi:hypothetical protein
MYLDHVVIGSLVTVGVVLGIMGYMGYYAYRHIQMDAANRDAGSNHRPKC